ncbi:hypothetical protein BC936DRAFT_139080 [Jimgerdemannia flammicorona]|uniref:PBZ-type domain-containing protein n=1 Tax=Jimgerdemannia flammicorona TaxID=994334 RepID=A0A433BAR0_9FUNG|nr:hypothetical protein BC936DRAFT_139080 [Jimgerdemannia flammicorona]
MKRQNTDDSFDSDPPSTDTLVRRERPPQSILDKFRFTKDKTNITSFETQPSTKPTIRQRSISSSQQSTSSQERKTNSTPSSSRDTSVTLVAASPDPINKSKPAPTWHHPQRNLPSGWTRRVPTNTKLATPSSLNARVNPPKPPVTPRSITPPDQVATDDIWDEWFDGTRSSSATLVPETPTVRSPSSRAKRLQDQAPSSDIVLASDPADLDDNDDDDDDDDDDVVMHTTDSDNEFPKSKRFHLAAPSLLASKSKPTTAISRFGRRAIILSPSSPAVRDQRDDNASSSSSPPASQSSSSSVSSFARKLDAFRFNGEGSNWAKRTTSQAEENDDELPSRNAVARGGWRKPNLNPAPTMNGKGSYAQRDPKKEQARPAQPVRWSSGSEPEEALSDSAIESLKPYGNADTGKNTKTLGLPPCQYGARCYRRNPEHLRSFHHPPARESHSLRTKYKPAIVESSAEEDDSSANAEYADDPISPVRPVTKRRRLTKRVTVVIDDGDEEEEERRESGYYDEKENVPLHNAGSKKGASNTRFDDMLARLQETFPNHPLSTIRRALDKVGGRSIDMAAQTLMFDEDGSLSEDMGSGVENGRPRAGGKKKLVRRAQRSPVIESDDEVVEVRNTARATIAVTTNAKTTAVAAKGKGKTRTDGHAKQQLIVLSDSEPEIETDSSSDGGLSHHGDAPSSPSSRNVDMLEARTLRFFNTAPSRDLQDFTGCTPEQAEQIIFGMRPFEGLEDLRDRLRKQRGMGERVINGYNEMMEGYDVVDQVIAGVEVVGEMVRKCVRVWQGGSAQEGEVPGRGAEGTEREGLEEDEETGVHLIEIADGDDAEGGQGTNAVDTKSRDYVDAMQGFLREQPAIVNPDIKLKGYQILGINWLLLLYRKGVSGILADEVGVYVLCCLVGEHWRREA